MSVVVPVRDRRQLLRDLLDGLARQTYDDVEVVVVDDGSTDGSGQEARRGAGPIPVRLVASEGRGAVAARSTGVRHATGTILAFTDSDCVPEPRWLEAAVASIEAGADVVQGVTRPVRPPGPLERTVAVSRPDGLYATCNVVYRREAFERAGGFDAGAGRRLHFRTGRRARGLGFGEDTLLAWRVRRDGTAAFAADAVVGHHVARPTLVEAISRAWMAGAFPALVREVPELRSTLLVNRLLLGRSRLALYAAVLAAGTGHRRLAGAALAGWAGGHVRRAARRAPLPAALEVAAVDALLDATTAAALLAGSIRARTPVL